MLTELKGYDDAFVAYSRGLTLTPNLAQAWLGCGNILADLRKYEVAMEAYDRALALNADLAAAWLGRGNVLCALERYGDALAAYEKALALQPDLAEAYLARGDVSTKLLRYVDALTAYDRALAIEPDLTQAWLGRSHVLTELTRYDAASAAYDQAITLMPDLGSPACRLLLKLLMCDEAIHRYDRALALAPHCVEDWFSRGVALVAVGRYGDAIASFDRAIAGKPDFVDAYLRRAKVLSDLHRHDDALDSVDHALALAPRLAQAWLGRAKVLTDLERYDDAFAAYDRALILTPNLAQALLRRGNILAGLKKFRDAIAAYDRALALNADLTAAWLGRGNILVKLKRYDDASAAYDRALAASPVLAQTWLGRGNVSAELMRYDDALAAYDRALAIKPDLAHAWLCRSRALTALTRYDAASAAYDRAVALMPDLGSAGGRLLFKLLTCDWTNLDAEVTQILAAVNAGELCCAPFTLLTIPSSPADQLQYARRFVQDQPKFPPLWRGEIYPHDRIRVAYLAAEFREHAMAYLMAGLFEQHDRSRFEITAISFGPDDKSSIRQRLRRAFEHFIDVRQNSDQEIADLIRRLEIDIAVDLMGFTKDNRLNVLARRPAPVQINYLGYPGTMGADHIDYILADQTIIPEAESAFYTEQVVWLPQTYQVNDNRRVISERTPTRRECGLPETAFVFCCFNNSYKILPEVFDIWMGLLRAMENSVLWLIEVTSTTSAHLRCEAQKRGVSPDRLIFARKANLADHLARHRQADLFVDTLPYNAHTTASDALWAGLPVLTCEGTTFASRVAASLLNAVGLDELITHSLQEYEALALKLAHDPQYLASFKARLAQNRGTCALFDTTRFTRDLESAFVMMWERYQRGEGASTRSQGASAKPIQMRRGGNWQ